MKTEHDKKNHRSYESGFIAGVESERSRIAQDIHDEAAQLIGLLQMNIKEIGRCEIPQLKEKAEELLNISENLRKELSSIVKFLKPLHLQGNGLFTAILGMIDRCSRAYGIQFYFSKKIELALTLNSSAKLELLIYRILQELVCNICRHASATKSFISVESKNKERLVISVYDNGKGIFSEKLVGPSDQTSYGLRSLKERVSHVDGQIHIQRRRSKGTKVKVVIPFSNEVFND